MDFGDGAFEIRIDNSGEIVHNMGEMALQAGEFLDGGDRE